MSASTSNTYNIGPTILSISENKIFVEIPLNEYDLVQDENFGSEIHKALIHELRAFEILGMLTALPQTFGDWFQQLVQEKIVKLEQLSEPKSRIKTLVLSC
jgi:hypothetical protein